MTEDEPLNFTWSTDYNQTNTTQLQIQLKFEKPLSVSQGKQLDRVIVYVPVVMATKIV